METETGLVLLVLHNIKYFSNSTFKEQAPHNAMPFLLHSIFIQERV